ncbi:hypothetical protein [Motiliproteus sediminis]|uniref:hypothetical protein n=1 Tax=Motiliproteus sediminis TaxID=1468178 RepID=UPI001AEFF0CC|nr:hypothetical protein [Motiliproteus sediminis]
MTVTFALDYFGKVSDMVDLCILLLPGSAVNTKKEKNPLYWKKGRFCANSSSLKLALLELCGAGPHFYHQLMNIELAVLACRRTATTTPRDAN